MSALAGRMWPVRPDTVFVSDFVHIDRPFDELAPIFEDDGAAWLTRLDATPWNEHVMAVAAGRARRNEGAVIVPLLWVPVGADSGMPKLEGDLELSDLGASTSRLSPTARYAAPRRARAWSFERFSLRYLAESTLRQFLVAIEATAAGRVVV